MLERGYSDEFEDEYLKKDGGRLPVSLRVWSAQDEVGNKVGEWAIVRDITEQKKVEKALQESELRYKRLVEDMNDGYYVVQGGIVVFANERSADMFQYARDEVIGKPITDFLTTDSLKILRELHARRLHGETVPQQYETTLTRKDGMQFTVEFGVRLIEYGAKPAVSVVIRDITERKKAEAERLKLEQQLQLAGRLAAVGELSAGVAHELNNPLAAIQGYAQFLTSKTDLDEKTRKDMEIIYREAQRASVITRNLLSFARRLEFEKCPISINEVIEKTLELNSKQMKADNIELATELDSSLPKALADFHQMQQVFANIITNAQRSMVEAHGKGMLIIRTRRAGDMIQATFTDDGQGIPEENLKKIFDPFFTTKEVGKGPGLGLSICYGIVEAHGGRIYADSKLGKGTTFVVEIPIASGDKHE